MASWLIGVIALGGLIVYLCAGVFSTLSYAILRNRVGMKRLDEIAYSWMIVGWPVTFFASLGLLVKYASERVERLGPGSKPEDTVAEVVGARR